MMDPIKIHEEMKGKIAVRAKKDIRTMEDLSIYYTPGVAKPCLAISKDREKAYSMTFKGNTVAIVTDGTRVLGLGDIGPEAALPVMEGKAMIMQQFAGIDAFPICLNTKNEDEIVSVVKAISPVFGAINLEDIETPKVFNIEKRLTEELDIPVFHDDQHGTAMVTLAGLINALKVTGKDKSVKIGIVGAGSAGYAIAKLLHAAGFGNITVFDSKGALHKGRNLDGYKGFLCGLNDGFDGTIGEFSGADVIISAAKPGSLPLETVRKMNKPNIVFALSNPDPEITLDQARELGIDVFGTGRSDYPNQINNSLCFPGFLRALLDLRVRRITDAMKIAAAEGIAESVENPTSERIVPSTFDSGISGKIFSKVKDTI